MFNQAEAAGLQPGAERHGPARRAALRPRDDSRVRAPARGAASRTHSGRGIDGWSLPRPGDPPGGGVGDRVRTAGRRAGWARGTARSRARRTTGRPRRGPPRPAGRAAGPGRWQPATGAAGEATAAATLAALAIENATEGCVRETFGALIAWWQAAAATDPAVRRVARTSPPTRAATPTWPGRSTPGRAGRLPVRSLAPAGRRPRPGRPHPGQRLGAHPATRGASALWACPTARRPPRWWPSSIGAFSGRRPSSLSFR